jgi:hypothetical protein
MGPFHRASNDPNNLFSTPKCNDHPSKQSNLIKDLGFGYFSREKIRKRRPKSDARIIGPHYGVDSNNVVQPKNNSKAKVGRVNTYFMRFLVRFLK